MSDSKKPMWFIAVHNKKTDLVSFFWNWANDSDELMEIMKNDFFDSPLTSITIPKDRTDKKIEMEHKTEIPFPSSDLTILRVKQVKDLDEHRELQRQVLEEMGRIDDFI
jgi:hypothetical protein